MTKVTEAERQELVEWFLDLPPFERAAAACAYFHIKPREPIADGLMSLELQENTGGDPVFDERLWERAGKCIVGDEFQLWRGLMFHAIRAGDAGTAARLEDLLERRLAN